MPLASRATQARAARVGAERDAADQETSSEVRDSIQPRRGATSAPQAHAEPEPAPSLPPSAPAAQLGAAAVAEAPAEAPAKAPRKPRAPRAQLPVEGDGALRTGNTDIKALKIRQREIEVAFKQLGSQEQMELRALNQNFKQRRQALEDEHRAIATKLSEAIFRG